MQHRERLDMQRVNATLAQRLVEARRMCGLSQADAAERLGYANSSGLCKAEDGHGNIQLWLVIKAAKVYEVSTDWLLGLTDDWEADERLFERTGSHWLYEAMEKHRERDMQALTQLQLVVRQVVGQSRDVMLDMLEIEHRNNAVLAQNTPNVEVEISRREKAIRRGADRARKLRNTLIKHRMLNDQSREQLVLSTINTPMDIP